MINRINMMIGDYNVFLDNESKKCIINDKMCELRDDDASNIIRIIRNWDYEYKDNKIISDNHYSIVVVCDDKKYVVWMGNFRLCY